MAANDDRKELGRVYDGRSPSGKYVDWLRKLARRKRFGDDDHLGTANLIDAESRLRGVRSVESGTVLSLGGELSAARRLGDDRRYFSIEVDYGLLGPFSHGVDHVEIGCHGAVNTHVDGFNHIGLDGTWYLGRPGVDPGKGGPSISDFGREGLLTRGVIADIPKLRGVNWVEPGKPVTGAELDDAVNYAGGFEPGDALLAYMGRDNYEAAGHVYMGDPSEASRPGLGPTAARWIAEHDVSVLAWDFLDADIGIANADGLLPVHLLIWAIGLVVVDNVDFSAAIPALRKMGRGTGLFVVAPLKIPGGTGCVVNPLLVV